MPCLALYDDALFGPVWWCTAGCTGCTCLLLCCYPASGTVSDEDHALELGPEWSAPSSNATKRRGPLGAVPEDQSTDPVDRRSPDDVVVIEDGPATATVEEETKTEGGGDVREGEGEGGKGGRGRRTTRPRSTGGSRTWDPVASAAERARAWRPLSAPTSRKLNMQVRGQEGGGRGVGRINKTK